MKIHDFHITGQYPTLSVETEVEDDSQNQSSQSKTVRVNLGPWDYVSLLSESELKSLVHLAYQKQHNTSPTQAMKQLKNASLDNASEEELP